jgi:hypothetical protein
MTKGWGVCMCVGNEQSVTEETMREEGKRTWDGRRKQTNCEAYMQKKK